MNNVLKYTLVFVSGAVLGVTVSYNYFKKKFEQIAEEEIESVKEVFYNRTVEQNKNEELEEKNKNEELEEKNYEYERAKKLAYEAKNKPSMIEYASKLSTENGYINYSDNKLDSKGDIVENGIEVIPPDEYGDDWEYDKICLTYYADKILADDKDEVIDNPDEIVGPEALDSFGEWEDYAVFVRNDKLKAYFEILIDNRNYYDVTGVYPHGLEE